MTDDLYGTPKKPKSPFNERWSDDEIEDIKKNYSKSEVYLMPDGRIEIFGPGSQWVVKSSKADHINGIIVAAKKLEQSMVQSPTPEHEAALCFGELGMTLHQAREINASTGLEQKKKAWAVAEYAMKEHPNTKAYQDYRASMQAIAFGDGSIPVGLNLNKAALHRPSL